MSALRSVEDFTSKRYDFIIVGGGTAGLVLAARLTENPDISVGVVEAGKNHLDDPLVDIPALGLQQLNNEDYDWKFRTEPQKANKNIRHHMPRGRMLGGSSGMNFMMYARGCNSDYDDWARITGDPGWSSAEVMRYMRKSQTLDPVDENTSEQDRRHICTESKNHSTSGPIHTSFGDAFMPIESDVLRAAQEATGLGVPADAWSGDHLGFGYYLASVSRQGPTRGKRSYAARAYFEPVQDRPNLSVICESSVSKVLLQGRPTAATGVEFIHGGKPYTIKAIREVIVCCGAIQSPQILELSGVGDPEVLQKAGVQCQVALPGVGANMQDHVMALAGLEMAEGIATGDAMMNPDAMAAAQKQYAESQGGPLTASFTAVGFYPYKMFATDEEQARVISGIKETRDAPQTNDMVKKQLDGMIRQLEDPRGANLQFALVPFSPGWDTAVEDQSTIVQPPPPEAKHQIVLSLNLEYPASRGSVHIQSSDVNDHPAIDPGYHTNPVDGLILGAGLRLVEGMMASSSLKDKIHRRTHPDPSVDLSDIEQAAAYVRELAMGQYHPIGTCAMGDVVDSKLKVKGVDRLRVCDASVFPSHVSGNICSSVYAVAERAADLIKEDF